MAGEDPIRDLERRLDRLEAKVDLSDQAIKSEIDGMRDDVTRIGTAYTPLLRFAPVEKIVYGLVAIVLLYVGNEIVQVVGQ